MSCSEEHAAKIQHFHETTKQKCKQTYKIRKNCSIPLPKNKQAALLDSEWRRLVCVDGSVVISFLYGC